MSKSLHWLLAALVLCGVAAAPPAAAQGRDHVTVVGSSTLFPFASAVAETFGRRGPWKTPVVESTGTGGGFKLFCRGVGLDTPDVTDASRPMTDSEKADCVRNDVGRIVALRVGSDGIVLASSHQAPHFNLTRAQLYRAVAKWVVVDGRLIANPFRRWNEIAPDLPDRPILVLGPAPNHGTRDAFAALALAPPCERELPIRALSRKQQQIACQTVREDGPWTDVAGDYATLFARLLKDPGVIGILGNSYLDQNRDRIQAASLDGVAPDAQSIAASTYPLSRPLFLYVKTAHVGLVPGLAEFVQEFVSDRAAGADGYLVRRGLTPQPESWRAREYDKALRLSTQPR
jgi:phosphate transport system substrate-binding protein